MSMRTVIESIEQDAFEKCMNQPEDGWGGVADVKVFEIGSWVVCPFCKKKAIKVLPDTQIYNMPWKCRGSNCGKEFVVNVGGKYVEVKGK